MGLHSIGGLDDFTFQRYLRAKAFYMSKAGKNIGATDVMNELLDLHDTKHNLIPEVK